MTERLAQIRQRCEAATPGPWGYDGQHDEITADSPDAKDYWLIVSQCRTAPNTAPRDGFGHQYSPDFAFIAAARDDVPYLLAEIERLTAERDALRADAALGALVRRMPEMLGHMYDDETDGECRTFLPDWVSLVLDKRPEEWLVQLGAEDSCLWWVADLGSPERVLAHALTVAATKEASDEQ